jgi:hypothetical protein
MTDTAVRTAADQLRDALKVARDDDALSIPQFHAVVYEFAEPEEIEVFVEREPYGLPEAIDRAGQAVHEGHDQFQWWQCSREPCVAIREIPGARRYA